MYEKTYLKGETLPKSCRGCRNNGVGSVRGVCVWGGEVRAVVATGSLLFNFRNRSFRSSLEGVSAQLMQFEQLSFFPSSKQLNALLTFLVYLVLKECTFPEGQTVLTFSKVTRLHLQR